MNGSLAVVAGPNNRDRALDRSEDAENWTGSRPKLVAIVGPTAVGKTRAGVELARRFNGEIVNADSRYLYRGFDIGVAKPTIVERRGVPHHLIDIIDAGEPMSLATYQELALAAINATLARDRLPFLVGGTPLYVNAVLEGWRIPRVAPDPAFRARMEAEIAERGIADLTDRLAMVDPVAATRAAGNPRRIVRALEIHAATGVPMSQQEGAGPRPFETLEIGLTLARPALHARIDDRVDWLIANGLVDEVRRLLEGGVTVDAPAMTSIGYRQLLPYLEGTATLAEAAQQIKTATHRYVRHQATWLRRNPRLVPIDVGDDAWLDRAAGRINEFLATTDP